MASAWHACCTMPLSSTSWNLYLCAVSERRPRTGIPSAPTVSHTPMKRIGTGSFPVTEQLLAEGLRRAVVGVVVVAVQRDRFPVAPRMPQPQDAALADHAGEAARGVGAAAEAEQEQLVAGLVVEHQEAVGLVEVVVQAAAEGAAGELVERAAGAHALVVEHQLRHRPGAARGEQRQLYHVGGAGLPVLLLVRAVPGAVAEDRDPFHVVHGGSGAGAPLHRITLRTVEGGQPRRSRTRVRRGA